MKPNTIWKFQLELADRQTVEMPSGSQILTVQLQHGKPCIWALVDTSQTGKEIRVIEIIGTGNPIPNPEDKREYIGTFQFMGHLVFHVFERVLERKQHEKDG